MRGVILVIDSLGIGAAPDAEAYGDSGANTLRSVCMSAAAGALVPWPNLLEMGIGNCAALVGDPIPGCPPAPVPGASFGAMAEKSAGKDTTTGHWELAGIALDRGFTVFPPHHPSFPAELVRRFEAESGVRMLGNKAASGTVIIEELGREQMRGGRVICYTSADSVFQIAAHEAVVPLEHLYRICRVARIICNDYRVARVIARPFTGTPGAFTRTAGRRDFSIELPGPSILDRLVDGGVETVGIGKIGDIFNRQGLMVNHPDKGNPDCLRRLVEVLSIPAAADQLIFVNLIDTDMVYGHRRDPDGYCRAVAEIDDCLTRIHTLLGPDDFLIITADHGCDPGFGGSDHTREYVPVLFHRPAKPGANLGVRDSFCDVAATVAACFSVDFECGTSLLTA